MANRFWVGGSGTWDASSTANWSASTGGAAGASAPSVADVAIFDGNSGAGTCTTSGSLSIQGLTRGTAAATNLTLGGSLTVSGAATHLLNTLNLDNNVLTCLTFSTSASGTRTLAFGATGEIVITGNNTTVYSSSTATNLTVTGTPKVTLNYAGSTGTRSINAGGATTYSPSNPKINFNITAGTDIVSLGGNNVYGNVDFTGFTGAYGFTASDPQFFGNLTFDAGMTGPSSATRALRFMATSGTQTITSNGVTIDSGITCEGGATYTFADALTQGATRPFTFSLGTVKLKNGVTSTVGAFATTGTTQKFLESTLAGSQATLSQASGTVSASYLTIKDINATGGVTWNAYVDNNNVDAGNNDGWDFGISPVVGGAEYTYTLRSFTQPRRF